MIINVVEILNLDDDFIIISIKFERCRGFEPQRRFYFFILNLKPNTSNLIPNT